MEGENSTQDNNVKHNERISGKYTIYNFRFSEDDVWKIERGKWPLEDRKEIHNHLFLVI